MMSVQREDEERATRAHREHLMHEIGMLLDLKPGPSDEPKTERE